MKNLVLNHPDGINKYVNAYFILHTDKDGLVSIGEFLSFDDTSAHTMFLEGIDKNSEAEFYDSFVDYPDGSREEICYISIDYLEIEKLVAHQEILKEEKSRK